MLLFTIALNYDRIKISNFIRGGSTMYQKRINRKTIFVIVVAIIMTLVILIIKNYYTEKTYVATFKGMYMQNTSDFWDKSLVYVETEEGEKLIFSADYLIRNEDGINLGFGHNCVWPDKEYKFTVIGWRINEIGIYEDIVHIEER